jgi:hypothetical protein
VVAQSQKTFPASAFSMEAAAESLSISSWKLIQKLVDSFASGQSQKSFPASAFSMEAYKAIHTQHKLMSKESCVSQAK